MTGWVEALKGWAGAMHYRKMHQAVAMSPPSSLRGGPWHRMSNTKPKLPIKHFRGNIAKHQHIPCPTKK